MDNTIVGIDIGGSHLTSAITDLKTGSIVRDSVKRGNVDSHGTANDIINEWAATIRQTLNGSQGTSVKIGIAMPGPFRYEHGISLIRNQNKYDALYGLNVKNLLAEVLGIPAPNIEFVNDAECFLKGEAFCGAVKEYKHAMGLTLGTGLGTAWYQDGRTMDAALWNYPFREGIAEDYLATRWFIKRYAELTGVTVKNVKDLAARAAHTDKFASQTFDEFGESLSAFLKLVIPDRNPQTIVIGGNIANAFELFHPSIKRSLLQHGISLDIYKTKLGEEAALIGAASVWDMRIPEDA